MKSVRTRIGILAASALALGVLLWVPSTASAAAHLEDLWCTSSSACVAVGASDSEEGMSIAHVKRWNGSAWTGEEVDSPEGTATSELTGVSCTSSSACTAVGSRDDKESDPNLPFAMRWDGSDWDSEDLPAPAGATSTKPADVACTSTSACITVGSYIDGEDVKKSLALSWNGTSWSLMSVPIPSGAELSELESISCTTSSDCVAVGSFVNSSEVTKTLAVSWNGSSWSIASTPEPEGAELNQLYDVSCRPSDACTAVGTYFDSTGDQKTLALRRNTSKVWSIQTTPNKSGALSRSLTAVSCASTTSCVAMGIVEQGRKEIPIALGWNGSTWSEQSIDTEALGAAAVNPAGVYCTSSTNCDAVGSVSYGRSAAPRNLAFHYNGSTWAVSEAGGYDRIWTSVENVKRASGLAGVSCPVSQRCFAVGQADDNSGAPRSQVASWAAGSWSTQVGPEPTEDTHSELIGISCASASSCWAVGQYFDDEETQHPLAVRWSGSAWTLGTAPSPSGAQAAVLTGIDCPSAGACSAVGTYVDAEGIQHPLAMIFDGASWSLASMPLPSGAAGGGLTGISCTSTTHCMAVGSQFDAFGHEESLSIEREGGTWSVVETPALEGEAPNLLTGVSCAAASACVAVGGFEDIAGVEHLLALTWDGSEWVNPDPGTPVVEGDELHEYSTEELADANTLPRSQYPVLSAVSCAAVDDCMAVGDRPPGSTQPPLVLRWDGTSWMEEPPADYPSGATDFKLSSISCVSAEECHATGSASYGGTAPKNAALTYDDGRWFAADATSRGGGMRGASCLSAESCVTVGDSIQPAGDPAMAWVLTEGEWDVLDASSAEGAYLSAVSCIDEEDCVAIGRKGEWPYKPLATHWNGEEWSPQSIPTPAGRSSNLESVTCSASNWCVAAGYTWTSTGAGPSAALIETWNGSAWSLASVSLPSGAVAAFLHDIACVSSSYCTAVGAYTDSSGVFHGLVERWNGTSWSASSVSPPSGQSYRLKGVDCTSTSACSAVGTSTSTANGSVTAIATRWNGSSWSNETITSPEGQTAGRLDDVDCYSPTRCVAVGSTSDPAGTYPFVVVRTESTWAREEAPGGTAGGSTVLESVSCPSAADCFGVGSSQSPGRPAEPFTVQTESETVGEETDPVKAPSEPSPVLTDEQEEDAMALLEEDPAFQAAIGAADYDYEIGAWTENDESGSEYLVGAYVQMTLKEDESWAERAWPIAAYDTGANGYEEGEYAEDAIDASASEIELLGVSLDLTFDSEANVIDGEAIEVMPLSMGPGDIDIDEDEFEYDQQTAGY